ncbi:unnamed protein product [Lactuca saligna]|uniref:Uncharacterized protein n=1 Tax=Lactuca saligna TaxID=75948 RepID=A0AA36EB56_LACSI|nr:unnamed protein product [Lactuca saligna]
MAGSSEHISFVDQSASLIILSVKHGQNVIIDLDSSRYDKVLIPIIECLKVASYKTSITKSHFSRLLGFSSSEALVDPKSVSHTTVIEKFYQMGYTGSDSVSKLFYTIFMVGFMEYILTMESLCGFNLSKAQCPPLATQRYCVLGFGQLWSNMHLAISRFHW